MNKTMTMKKVKVKFYLNGIETVISTVPNRRLIDMLREDLNLTGTKEGCAIGECGACTVIINGKTVNSCLVLAAQINECNVTTIEGIVSNGELHPLQENFMKYGAIQCGFCTPGMVLSAYALLQEKSNPTEDEIKEALSGNLCRCTGYKQIIEAVKMTKSIS